jgi:hypothetical protein
MVALTGCLRYRFALPNSVLQAPDTQIWGVNFQKSGSGYRIHSITKFNGSKPLNAEPTAPLASGKTETWQWEVLAVPSLLPSWKAWQDDKKVQQRIASQDDWSHPAANWEQAFSRSYKVVNFLLGRPPLPMKLKVLLIPDGSAYHKDFVQTGDGFVPLTFAFYYPSSENKELTGARFSALVEAVSKSIYEYQHVMDDTGMIKLIGKDETDQTINDEARSHCWYDSNFFALTSGTHTSVRWNPPTPQDLMAASATHNTSLVTGKQDAEGEQEKKRNFSDAALWGRYLEAKSISAYLQERGIRDGEVLSNDPARMNAVLSLCRAMTQQPLDLTAGAYPASKVDYVAFFPPTPDTAKAKEETGAK